MTLVNLIHGIPVVLHERVQVGTDGFGAPTYAYGDVTVEDCLVAPATATDVIDSTMLEVKALVYTICVPKGDTHTWEDNTVTFFGKTFKVFGPAKEYIEDNIPLRWNKQLMAELYE